MESTPDPVQPTFSRVIDAMHPVQAPLPLAISGMASTRDGSASPDERSC